MNKQMKQLSFSVGDMAEVTGYSVRQLRNMRENSVLIPENNPIGKGSFAFFGLMQVLALCYLCRHGQMPPRYAIEAVLDFLTDMSERELLAHFKQGRTHLIPKDGRMQLVQWTMAPALGDVWNLKDAYDGLIAVIPRVSQRDKKPTKTGTLRGRTTALVNYALSESRKAKTLKKTVAKKKSVKKKSVKK